MRQGAVRRVFVGVGCTAAALAAGQSYNAFDPASTTGVTVTHTSIVTGQNAVFDVSLAPGAQLTYSGNVYPITQIFGFWNLSAAGDIYARDGGANVYRGTRLVNWSWKADGGVRQPGPYKMAGWNGNPNALRIRPGDTGEFTYLPSSATNPQPFNFTGLYGFHFQYRLTNGQLETAYFGIPAQAPSPVPEPATIALAGAGIGLALRRRRQSARV